MFNLTVQRQMDENIKRNVEGQLKLDPRLDSSAIEVQVASGQVRLGGSVPSYSDRLLAREASCSVAGVNGVTNQLQVKFLPESTVPRDSDMAVRCEQVLSWMFPGEAHNIAVLVSDGWATLTGNVDALWKRVRAERLFENMYGLTGISNELVVVPSEKVSDEIIRDDIMQNFTRSFSVDPNAISVIVSGGEVTLRGILPNWDVWHTVCQLVTYTPGVIAVVDELSIDHPTM